MAAPPRLLNEELRYRASCPRFDAFLSSYRRLYDGILDAATPTSALRVLVVREAMARRGVGLGLQTAFIVKWLLLGMALGRPVYFEHCSSPQEAWTEPEAALRSQPFAAPNCTK
eukprot:540778-Prymnesium_polylepis.1